MSVKPRPSKPLTKPLIGVTGPDRGGLPAWLMTRLAIWRAGGRARRITPSRPCRIEEVDGLVIGGGADVDPALYGEALLPQIKKEKRRFRARDLRRADFVLLTGIWLFRTLFSASSHQTNDHARDRLETYLILAAIQDRLPILGICRGMQLINVTLGGSLYQDIEEFYDEEFYEETPQLRTVLPRKKVEIDPDSKLHRLLHQTSIRVNSLHHQSVKKLGRDLRIAAIEPKGIVQSIEHGAFPFVIGVQWHPEFLPQERRQLGLFRALVRHAADRWDDENSSPDFKNASPIR